MTTKVWGVAIVAAIVASLGLGYWIGSGSSKGYAMYTGDCSAGEKEVSCSVGNVTYGVQAVVAWTDADGVGRGGVNDSGEWPTCLVSGEEVKDLHFAGAMLPIGDSSTGATIVWIDCRGR